MPEMNIGIVSGRTRFLGHRDLWVRVIAYMMWPHDEDRRRAFVAYRFAKFIKDCEASERPVDLDPELFEERKRGTLEILIRDFHELAGSFAALAGTGDGVQEVYPAREWSTVGYVLHFIRSMKADGKAASVNKAVYMIAKWERPDIAEVNVIRNQTEIKEAWRRYKNISHLAAAFIILQQAKERFKPHEFEDFFLFLAVAKSFQDFATKFIPFPPKKRLPLLDPNQIWSVPSSLPLPEMPIALALSEENVKTLRRYRA